MADAVQHFRPWLLLVEDEAPLAEAIRLNLENEFELAVAGTVEEARVLLGARQYAIIVSDHMMPGKQQGLAFLMEALEQQPTARRILMTGYLNPEFLGRSMSVAQLSACLIKPVPIDMLRQALHRSLAT